MIAQVKPNVLIQMYYPLYMIFDKNFKDFCGRVLMRLEPVPRLRPQSEPR